MGGVLAGDRKVGRVSVPHRQAASSVQYVLVPVRFTASGVVTDPTSAVVTMAFIADGATPVSGDFKTASWETDPTTNPDTYYARCLVGTGGAITLAVGVYRIWVKVTDSPEAPVLKAGLLEVF